MKLCNLNTIPTGEYQTDAIDANICINSTTEIRTKSEILEKIFFYYRTNWACVDTKPNGIEIIKQIQELFMKDNKL